MAFAISSPSGFQKEIIERKIVPDGVPPALPSMSEIREIVENILVDISQHQLLVRAAEDGHGNQANVGVLRLWLLGEWDAEQARV